jgi:ubiquinone/menaquinone biosynthesis C-methylase UbiE
MTKNADYADIAPRYNSARPLARKDMDYWAEYVSDLVPRKENVKLLDLGCGNGRFSILFAKQLGFTITGVDSSAEMIQESIKNDIESLVKWKVEDSSRLTFDDEAFDVVWISHLLHLVDDPERVISECYRVLKKGGLIIDRYTSLEDNLREPERKLFPELADLDTGRIPTQSQVESWLVAARFNGVDTRHLQVPTYADGAERLARVASRVESGLTMISDAAFNTGLQALEKYVNDNPHDDWILDEKYTITIAKK